MAGVMTSSQDEQAGKLPRAVYLNGQGDVPMTLDETSIPKLLIERSPVLKTALESEGAAALPITQSAFQLWCQHAAGAEESFEDACTLLEVRPI